MSVAKRSVRGFIWNHFAKLTDYGLAYLFAVIFARRLGASEFGVYVTMMSIASATILIGGAGLDVTLIRYIPQFLALGKEGGLRFLARRLLATRSVVVLVICACLFVLSPQLGIMLRNERVSAYVHIIVFYVFLQSLVNFFSNLYTAKLRTKTVFIVTLITRIGTILVALTLLSLGFGLYSFFFLLSVASAGGLLAYFIGEPASFIGFQEPVHMRPVYEFSLVAWLIDFVALALGRYSVILLLGYHFGTSPQAGYFDIAFSLTILIEYIFAVGFVGVSLSVFSELAVRNRAKLGEARAKIMKYHQALIFPASVFCLLYPDFVIKFLFSEQYLPAVPLFRSYLSFNLVAVSILGSGSSVGVLLALGKERIVVLNRAIIGFANLGINFFIIPLYGAFGAITVSGACVLLTFLVEFIISSRFIGFYYDVKFAAKIVIVSGLSVLVVGFIPVHSTISFFLAGVLYTLMVVSGYYLLKLVNLSFKELLNPSSLLNRLKSH